MNSTDKAYKRDNFLLEFLDAKCVPTKTDYTQQDIADCNEAISEYEYMLQYAIDVGDKREISNLRAEIQHLKAEKRNIKRMLKNRMELAPT